MHARATRLKMVTLAIERFIVTATDDYRRCYAQLTDANDHTTAKLGCMPASVRESGIAVVGDRAFTPSADGRLLAPKLTADGDFCRT